MSQILTKPFFVVSLVECTTKQRKIITKQHGLNHINNGATEVKTYGIVHVIPCFLHPEIAKMEVSPLKVLRLN